MRINVRSRVIGAALLALALVAAACGSGDDAGGATTTGQPTTTPTTTPPTDLPTITVGSGNFSEAVLIAEIYAQALEAKGWDVGRELNTGSREIYKAALESGELDLVPEYVGTMLSFLGGTPTADSQATWEALKEAWEPAGITVLNYASAQDKNGFVVTAEFAATNSVSKVSDLAAFNGELVLGGPPECPNREFCLIGLNDVYGLEFADFKPLDVGGPITVTALESGEIDVALLFTSDGVIAAKGFVLLEDDMNLQPAENVVPAIRTEIVDAYGQELIDTLNAVSAVLTTEELTELNKRVGFDGEDPEAVATDWLTTNGLI